MKIILFPGNSLNNKKWSEDFREYLLTQNYQVFNIEYDHWQKQGTEIDINLELEKIRKLAQKIDSDYILIAKSIGSILSLIALQEKILNPSKIIILGFPLRLIKNQIITALDCTAEKLLKNVNVQTFFFQNEHDPVTSYKSLQEYLNLINNLNFEIIMTDGDTHNYNEFNKYILKI